MNVAAYQQKKKDENTKTGKRRENRDDRFQKGCVLSFCGRLGGSTVKKWFV